jgi:tetratricopeptide (TPR) repeat protein
MGLFDFFKKDKKYYAKKGFSYRNRGKFDKAIEYFDKAMELDVDKVDYGYYCRAKGQTYYDKGDYDKALEYWKECKKITNNSAHFWGLEGNVYYHLGIYDKAIDCCETCIRLIANKNGTLTFLEQNDVRDASLWAGLSYGKMGIYNAAIIYVKQAADLGSETAKEYIKKLKIEYK